jgi:hypothetical protein
MGSVAAFLTGIPSVGRSSAEAGIGRRPPAGLVKAFELINRLYGGLARIDARIAPLRLAMVLLAVAEKPRQKGRLIPNRQKSLCLPPFFEIIRTSKE